MESDRSPADSTEEVLEAISHMQVESPADLAQQIVQQFGDRLTLDPHWDDNTRAIIDPNTAEPGSSVRLGIQQLHEAKSKQLKQLGLSQTVH